MDAIAEQDVFPCTVLFERDELEVHFNDMKEFTAWLDTEVKFWNKYIGTNDQIANVLNRNMTILREQNATDDASFSSRIKSF